MIMIFLKVIKSWNLSIINTWITFFNFKKI